MILELNIDAARPLALLRNGGKRMAYAVVNALNDTAKYVQKKEHEHVRSLFNIRQETYLFGTAARPGGAAGRITKFASVGRGVFSVAVVVDGGALSSKRRLLLPLFEGGGTKEHRSGSKSVAIPITGTARPTMSAKVDLTFGKLKLQKFQGGKRVVKPRRGGKKSTPGVYGEFGVLALPGQQAGVQWKGQQRSFLLPSSKKLPQGGVLQRTGPKRGDVRLLYKFQKSVTIPNRLRFTYIFNQEAPPYLQAALAREVQKTLAFQLAGVRL